MAMPKSNIPLLLLPLKLETRFVKTVEKEQEKNELWIRVFPDLPFLQNHDPRLTKEERTDTLEFEKLLLEEEGLISKEEKLLSEDEKRRLVEIEELKKELWDKLVAKYGVYRASWLIHIAQKKEVATQEENTANDIADFYFKWLPNKLVFYVYPQGEEVIKKVGEPILAEGLPILKEGKPEDSWLQNFDKAMSVGMGVKIPMELTKKDKKNEEKTIIITDIERIIVSGIRKEEDPLTSQNGAINLFQNHQYTEGLSFLKYGTPTNNSETTKSGHTARDEFNAIDSFAYAVEGLDLDSLPDEATAPTPLPTAGKYLAQALGVEADVFKHTRDADIREPLLNDLYQQATWFALGAQPLFMLFRDHISSDMHEKIWEHYSQYVKARGLYAPLKIGNQPYGILPVMSVRNALTDPDIQQSDELMDKMWLIFAYLLDRWIKMVEDKDSAQRVPRLGDEDDDYAEMLKILSLQEHSTSYQIRALAYAEDAQAEAITRQNVGSFTALLRDLAGDKNRLSHVPLLGFKDAKTGLTGLNEEVDTEAGKELQNLEDGDGLLGFQNGKTSLVSKSGQTLLDKNGAPIFKEEDAFSFTQEDLSGYKDFIKNPREKENGQLIPYEEDLSLFTDLLLRSYLNACQLYYREMTFEPGSIDVKKYPYLTVESISEKAKAEKKLKKGDKILTIIGKNKPGDHATQKASAILTAPFDGRVERIAKVGDTVIPGITLCTLMSTEKNEKGELKYEKIKNVFTDLTNKIHEANKAILEEKRVAAQEEAIREALDINSYRIDAWMTSLAARQIQEMRAQPSSQKGIYIGAYGWIEGLKKDEEKTVERKNDILEDETREDEGGIIHTTRPAQAVASAIFKNAYLSHKKEQVSRLSINQEQESNPFALNLTSDRLQKAQVLLEGIRQGQQLEALLGYQLERYLHEDKNPSLNGYIYTLREAFPLFEDVNTSNAKLNESANLSVIDGLKAIKNKDNPPNGISGAKWKTKIRPYIEKLEDTLDASLDALFYEAGYQVTQGNLTQAAAALDATKGEIEPPELEALKTRIPGTGIAHKLIMVFPTSTQTYSVAENCRASAEPILENWLKIHFGHLNKIGCMVELFEGEDLIDTVPVRLGDLNIGYLDFLYLSEAPVSQGASELELRIGRHVFDQRENLSSETRYNITTVAPAGCQSLVQALEVAQYTYNLLSKCRYLKSEDISMEDEAIDYDRDGLERIKTRLADIKEELKGVKEDVLTQIETLSFLAKLDIELAKTALLGNNSVDTSTLTADIERKIITVEGLFSEYEKALTPPENEQEGSNEDTAFPFSTAFEYLAQIAQTLFGAQFILLPPAKASDHFAEVIHQQQQHLLVGKSSDSTPKQAWGQKRIHHWVQGLAQVQENTEVFEDWLMINEVWNQRSNSSPQYAYQVVQGPTILQYPWVALSKKEIDSLLETHYKKENIYQNPHTGESYPLADGDYYPDGCDSTVLYAPEGFSLEKEDAKTVYGLVIEEFSEHIPNEKVDTGLSFNYNAPNNEPPQAMLLAVHPKAGKETDADWTEDHLKDILYDTMDLYKIRMVDIEAMEEYGYVLPMPYWLNVKS